MTYARKIITPAKVHGNVLQKSNQSDWQMPIACGRERVHSRKK